MYDVWAAVQIELMRPCCEFQVALNYFPELNSPNG